MKINVAVVIPNWNGASYIQKCLKSLKHQSLKPQIIVVDNGSNDNSVKLVQEKFPSVQLIQLERNTGFAGGVNAGIHEGFRLGAKYILLLNNDAIADENWVKNLVEVFEKDERLGVVASKMIAETNPPTLDSTGEMFSSWGLPFPRGRGHAKTDRFDKGREIFGASGGASGYRSTMLKQVGLFDEDFFAYFEDVDISFRARLAGWNILFEPTAVVTHQIGGTSRKMRGFTTYHTFKNLPLVLIKNMPKRLLITILPKFLFAYFMLFIAKIVKLELLSALRGVGAAIILTPKKIRERHQINKLCILDANEISSLFYQGIPPSYSYLYRIRHPFSKPSD